MKDHDVVKKDGRGKGAKVIWNATFQFPETLDEWLQVKGSEWCCDHLTDDYEIELRALNDPRKAGGIIPKSDMALLRMAVEDGDMTLGELREFVKASREAKEAANK